MYSRELDGKTYTFGVSGKLWRDALLMYDHQTRSLWSHITGEAIQGPLKGKQLQPLASMPQIAWKTWMANYPDTSVLSVSVRGRMLESLDRDSYQRYHTSQDTGVSRTKYNDKRLPNKSLVIGIQVEDKNGKHSRAYPLSQKNPNKQFYNDTLGEVPLLIWHHKESFATAVYNRTVDGTVEEFTSKGDYSAIDSSGTEWNLITGEAISGKQKGMRLERIPVVNIYWFAWARYYPETTIYSP